MVDATRSSKGLAFVQLENGWIEVQPKSSAGEMLQNAFCEHLMTSGVWTAAFRILSGKDEKEGGIFLGIVPDGCSSVVPLGDRHAGIGWGKAKPYVVWNEAVARPCLSQRYPFHPEPMTVRMEQRHYTFQYAVGEVVGLLKTWGYGHYETNFRRANMDGLKLLNLSDQMLEKEVGMSDANERTYLVGRVQGLFKLHSFNRGDVIKMVLDLEQQPPTLTLLRREPDGNWAEVGQRIRLEPKTWGRVGWRFGVTLNSAYDVVQVWSCKGRIEHLPPLPKGTKPAAKPAAEGGSGGGEHAHVGQGTELSEGSLADWRYVEGQGKGAFAHMRFLVLYNISSAVIAEVPLSLQPHILLQTLLPPCLSRDGGAPAYKTPNAGASRHVVALSAHTGSLSAAEWKAPHLVATAVADLHLTGVARDPRDGSSSLSSLPSGADRWAVGEGCSALTRSKLVGAPVGRRVVGADEGIEWLQLGCVGQARADTEAANRACMAGQWRFEMRVGQSTSLMTGALRPGVAMVVMTNTAEPCGLCLHLTSAGLIALIAPHGGSPVAGVLALRGLAAHTVTAFDANNAISALRAIWRPDEASRAGGSSGGGGVGVACRPCQVRDLLRGDKKARALSAVSKPQAYGEDPRIDCRLYQRRNLVNQANLLYRPAPKSGAPTLSFWESECKLAHREQILNLQLQSVEKLLSQLPEACSGHELVRQQRAIRSKLVRAALERKDLEQFSAKVTRGARRKLRVGAHGRERDAAWAHRDTTVV
jgi:hypothetical protein